MVRDSAVPSLKPVHGALGCPGGRDVELRHDRVDRKNVTGALGPSYDLTGRPRSAKLARVLVADLRVRRRSASPSGPSGGENNYFAAAGPSFLCRGCLTRAG